MYNFLLCRDFLKFATLIQLISCEFCGFIISHLKIYVYDHLILITFYYESYFLLQLFSSIMTSLFSKKKLKARFSFYMDVFFDTCKITPFLIH